MTGLRTFGKGRVWRPAALHHDPGAPGEDREDPRLARLFDYTKFHIGVYLSAGGGLMTVAALGVEHGTALNEMIGSPLALIIALICMLLAGVAGGVITSACTKCRTFDELWEAAQGPFQLLRGKSWAFIEHTSFWVSVLLLAYCVVSAPGAVEWIFSNR